MSTDVLVREHNRMIRDRVAASYNRLIRDLMRSALDGSSRQSAILRERHELAVDKFNDLVTALARVEVEIDRLRALGIQIEGSERMQDLRNQAEVLRVTLVKLGDRLVLSLSRIVASKLRVEDNSEDLV